MLLSQERFKCETKYYCEAIELKLWFSSHSKPVENVCSETSKNAWLRYQFTCKLRSVHNERLVTVIWTDSTSDLLYWCYDKKKWLHIHFFLFRNSHYYFPLFYIFP